MTEKKIKNLLTIISVKLDYLIHATGKVVAIKTALGSIERKTITGEEQFIQWIEREKARKGKPIPVESKPKKNAKR